jgi:Ca2+-binding RTX toxin-like protein
VNVHLDGEFVVGGYGLTGDAKGDKLNSIENLIGSAHTDVLYGSSDGNKIHGGSGNDQIRGEGGADELHGGAGNDSISALDGSDFNTGGSQIYGEDGNDGLLGSRDDDLISGGAGDDYIRGDAGANTLSGGSGQDKFAWQIDGEFKIDDVVTDFDPLQDALEFYDPDGGVKASFSVGKSADGDVLFSFNGGSVELDGVQNQGWISAGHLQKAGWDIEVTVA